MESKLIYLDTYVLQQDMRIRLPKTILANMGVERGKTQFDIFLDTRELCLILRINKSDEGDFGDGKNT